MNTMVGVNFEDSKPEPQEKAQQNLLKETDTFLFQVLQ
jgi:hypothetical protein